MEYVIVELPEDRGVLIDDAPSGNTNTILMVEAGHHEFTLDGEKNFDPETITELVQFTTADKPQVLKFALLGASPANVAAGGQGADGTT